MLITHPLETRCLSLRLAIYLKAERIIWLKITAPLSHPTLYLLYFIIYNKSIFHISIQKPDVKLEISDLTSNKSNLYSKLGKHKLCGVYFVDFF